MTGKLAFFSFVELTDQTQHRAYNEWHQLDHLPENRALPGVGWGDRWGRPPEFKDASTPLGALDAVDYVTMYWFREPLEQSIAEWNKLAEDSFQWGRGALLPGVERRFLAFFTPVRGYASPRALVSPEVIPLRPHRGVHVSISRIHDQYSAQTHAHYVWEDRVLMPKLLDVPGVAGAWTLSFSHHLKNTMPFGGAATEAPGSYRARVLFFDGDPIEASSAAKSIERDLADRGEMDLGVLTAPVFSSALKTLVPWQDW